MARAIPMRLSGEEIPRAARMLCIADVYDALMSKRSYKGALSHDAALEIMRSRRRSRSIPMLFALFEDLMRTRAPSMRQRAAAHARPAPEHRVTPARELRVSGPSDDLTGLLTRRPFVEIANTILGERGPFATMSLIVLDVDEFKQVNDLHGHLQGDAVLRVIAGTLRELAASSGIIGRYAGDEFVILLPHAALDEAGELAERIRATVRRTSIPLRERSGSISATLSIGVAGARPEHRDFDALFAVADRAMYEAKRRGRDTVVSSTEGDHTSQGPAINLKHFVGRESESKRLLANSRRRWRTGRSSCPSSAKRASASRPSCDAWPARRDSARGCLVTGQCSEAGNKPPYAPWAEVLTALDSLGVVRRARMARAAAPRSDDVERRPVARVEQVRAARARSSPICKLAAETNPVVVLLDDMQWSDAASWDVLEHVMSQLEMEHVLLCITMRTEDIRGESLERRSRLLRDERFNEIPLSRLIGRRRAPVALGRFRRGGEPRTARVPPALLGGEPPPRDAGRTHPPRCRRRAVRARSLGALVRAVARAHDGAERPDGAPARSPRPASAIDPQHLRRDRPRVRHRPRRRRGGRHGRRSARCARSGDRARRPRSDRLERLRIRVHARSAGRRRSPIDQSAPSCAHSRAGGGGDGGA